MSDCFDHALDAYDNFEANGHDYGDEDCNANYDLNYRDPYFERDPYYYYKYTTATIHHQTEKAYLLDHEKGKFWIPKGMTKMKDDKLMINKAFNPKYLENNVTTNRSYTEL